MNKKNSMQKDHEHLLAVEVELLEVEEIGLREYRGRNVEILRFEVICCRCFRVKLN